MHYSIVKILAWLVTALPVILSQAMRSMATLLFRFNLRQVSLALLLGVVLSSCAAQIRQTQVIASKQVVRLPPPPSFLGPCKSSSVTAGEQPNIAFDAEHIALKECSSQGAKARSWYSNLRKGYAGSKLK